MILKLVQVVFTPPYYIVGIVGSISRVSTHSIVIDAYKIRGLVRPISLVLWHIVPSLLRWVYVLPIVRIVLWLLLAIDQGNSIHIVILMMIVLVPPHDKLFLSSLEANRSYRLGTIARNIDVSHILIPFPKVAIGHHIWKHLLLYICRVIKVNILLPILLMHWRLSFHGGLVLLDDVRI